MPENKGLVGLRPVDEAAAEIFTAPPYDVITYGTPLQEVLSGRENIIHVHLRPPEEGEARYPNAKKALDGFVAKGLLIRDDEPSYYVYRQSKKSAGLDRIGVLLACRVYDYKDGKVIRHEKTFDDKVVDRRKLFEATGYQLEVVFSVVEDRERKLMEALTEVSKAKPLYSFMSSFGGASDMEKVRNDVWKVPESSGMGKRIKQLIESENAYIADGHHRYHCALLMGCSHVQMYISPSGSAKIQPYDRVVGSLSEEDVEALPAKVKEKFEVAEHGKLEVPEKHNIIFYFKDRILTFKARPGFLNGLGDDPVAKLDCSILKSHIFSSLPQGAKMGYFPGSETGFAHMKKLVDSGEYQFAVSLAPVEFSELKAVADKGIANPEIVMPQKSTYFWPKILSGLFLYKY
ncbi:MAG: DUF1015 domain-containing protein [Candidatus Micrarchaeota archaeon]|nr:DUF1015 domain-containing protein [Candidatus Micrarchaeota archaeon]